MNSQHTIAKLKDSAQLINSHTCFIVSLDNSINPVNTPLHLQNGEVLEVGDKFTQLGRKGCSYKNGILLNDGWVQRYEGSVKIQNNDKEGRVYDYKLFSAYTIDTGLNALEGYPTIFTKKYLAYTQYEDLAMGYFGQNEGFHFFETDYLIRYK
ncbi:hypothetical protein V6259_12770 [Marinomonas sp. TI.3.20]|uniref:hypothetical protein n=1 Tax=Marinomonas sp. TI.3.20 TaxID=3121296 RepID=UPI00311DC885